MWLGAAGRKLGTGLAWSAIPWRNSIPQSQAEAPVVRPGCASEGHRGAPHHGPQHTVELLPLLPADCCHEGCQLPSSRLQPLYRGWRGPQPWRTPGPERSPACQPSQELVCLCGDPDSELCP